MLSIPIQKQYPDSKIPVRATEEAAGLDLYAHNGEKTLAPGEWTLVGTGIALKLPSQHVGLVCPRSGLAAKHGVTVVNGPGVVDADYTGEIKVIIINTGHAPFVIEKDMRIAQLVIVPCPTFTLTEVTTLDSTNRGAGGFGHTGTNETPR